MSARKQRQRSRRYHLVRRGLIYSLFLVAAILLLGGVGFRLLDPKVHNLQDGLWLAFTHPLVFLALLALAVLGMLWLLPRVWRFLTGLLHWVAGEAARQNEAGFNAATIKRLRQLGASEDE